MRSQPSFSARTAQIRSGRCCVFDLPVGREIFLSGGAMARGVQIILIIQNHEV
jgi:hypothetical protein